MNKSKIITIAIITIMIISGMAGLLTSDRSQGQTINNINNTPETTTNTQGNYNYLISLSGVPGGTGYYQQLITIDPADYNINANGSNIQFSSANGTLLYAWIQSISTSSMSVWVKNYNSSSSIVMQVYPGTDNFFNATGYLEEAPQLSPIYGEYSVGATEGLIFPDFWDFAGTTLPSSWEYYGTEPIINNGTTLNEENELITTVNQTYLSRNILEADVTETGTTGSQGFGYVEGGPQPYESTSWGYGTNVGNGWDNGIITNFGSNDYYETTYGNSSTGAVALTGFGNTGTSGIIELYTTGQTSYGISSNGEINSTTSNPATVQNDQIAIGTGSSSENLTIQWLLIRTYIPAMPTYSISNLTTPTISISGPTALSINETGTYTLELTGSYQDPIMNLTGEIDNTIDGKEVNLSVASQGTEDIKGTVQGIGTTIIYTAYLNITINPTTAYISFTSKSDIADTTTYLNITVHKATNYTEITTYLNANTTIKQGNNITNTFNNAGENIFYVVVSFPDNYTKTYRETILIYLNVNITASNNNVFSNSINITFKATIQGGSGTPSYTWNLGINGQGSNSAEPGYTYSAGNYTITLEITEGNLTGNATYKLEIKPVPFLINYSPDTNITTETQLNLSITRLWDAIPIDYIEYTINGVNYKSGTLTYEFLEYQATQEIQATVYTTSGVNFTLYANITMTPTPIIINTQGIPQDITPQILDMSVNITDPDATSWIIQWNINGQTYSGEDLSYNFANTGTYKITITVQDNIGVEASKTIDINVENPGSNAGIIITSNKETQSTDTDTFQIEARGTNLTEMEVVLDHEDAFVNPIQKNGTYIFQYSIDTEDYQAGSYTIHFIIFSDNGQSNTTETAFTITPNQAQPSIVQEIITAMGGPTNIIIIIGVMGSIIGGYEGYKNRNTEVIDVNGQEVLKTKHKPIKKAKKTRRL